MPRTLRRFIELRLGRSIEATARRFISYSSAIHQCKRRLILCQDEALATATASLVREYQAKWAQTAAPFVMERDEAPPGANASPVRARYGKNSNWTPRTNVEDVEASALFNSSSTGAELL